MSEDEKMKGPMRFTSRTEVAVFIGGTHDRQEGEILAGVEMLMMVTPEGGVEAYRPGRWPHGHADGLKVPYYVDGEAS